MLQVRHPLSVSHEEFLRMHARAIEADRRWPELMHVDWLVRHYIIDDKGAHFTARPRAGRVIFDEAKGTYAVL